MSRADQLAEAIDTLLRLGWALLAWIAVLAFIAMVILLTTAATGAWAVIALWRAWRPRKSPETRSGDSRATTEPERPADGRTEPHDYREAA